MTSKWPEENVWLVVAILTSLIFASCGFPFRSRYSDFPLQRELQFTDFPSTWYRLGGTFEEVEGAEYYHRVAYGPDEDLFYLTISQHLAVYPDNVSASSDYDRLKRKWFPTDDWKVPTDFSYSPIKSDDRNHLACTNFIIDELPILSCGYLQQHDEFISLVLANIDGELVTRKIFLAALEAQDRRLNK